MQAFHAVAIPPTIPSILPRCLNASISYCCVCPYIYLGVRMQGFHAVAIPHILPRCSNASISRCCYSPYDSFYITSVFKCKHFTLMLFPIRYLGVRMQAFHAVAIPSTLPRCSNASISRCCASRCSDASISHCCVSPLQTHDALLPVEKTTAPCVATFLDEPAQQAIL